MDIKAYQLTDKEKQDLINRVSQDVTFMDEESHFENEEESYHNEESQDESDLF